MTNPPTIKVVPNFYEWEREGNPLEITTEIQKALKKRSWGFPPTPGEME